MTVNGSGADRAPPVYARIAAHYRGLITGGDLKPGDRLPPVRELASTWKVARQTADRAVSALREEGLVRTAGRSGTVVLGEGEAGSSDLAVAVALGRRPPLNVASANVVVATGRTARDLLVEPGTSVLVVRLDEDGSGR